MSNEAPALDDRDARIAVLEAQLAEAQDELRSRDLLIETLRVQLARLKRMAFGRSSEKLGDQIAQLELALEELEAEAEAVAASRPVDARLRSSPIRTLPPHLPRTEQTHEPPGGNCACPDCGGPLRRMGEDTDELLDVVPISWRVVRHVRPKYSCRTCERIVQAPTPAKPIAKGKATFATLAHVLDHGEVEIDNGVAERALRGVAVGRRNWLFAGSVKGGERAAAIYSVIETARMNGIEPQAYIADILARIGEGWPASRLDELMPWNWQPETELLKQAA